LLNGLCLLCGPRVAIQQPAVLHGIRLRETVLHHVHHNLQQEQQRVKDGEQHLASMHTPCSALDAPTTVS
jgi:hypothetical protein